VRLIQVLSIVLTEFSIGSLLMTSLMSTREIRLGFFTLNSLLAALAAAFAFLLAKIMLAAAWADVRFLGLTIIGATTAWGCFRLEKPDLGRIFLIVSAIVGVIFGLLPLAEKVMAARGMRSTAQGYFTAGTLAGALLLGAVNVGMILGHWYLLMRRLSFEYLERASQIVLGAVALRWLVLVATLATLRAHDPAMANQIISPLWSPSGNLFFFAMRLMWGLVLPLVLGVLVLRCVMEKANQAATGMLYVLEVSVIFGELFAAYLMI
jgi:hypothetical protein